MPVLLEALLRERQWHRYGIFRVEYDRAAETIDRHLVGTAPSRAQLHRWISGELRRLPYVDHCRVLMAMFPGHTAEELFGHISQGAFRQPAGSYADVAAVFTSRSDFIAGHPPHQLFDDASRVQAAGLSLNLLCQQYPDRDLARLVDRGGTLQCLFLRPYGAAVRSREQEEDYPEGHLSQLTELNMQLLVRLRDRLPAGAQPRVRLATYDEIIRFNIILIDGVTGIVQPYLPTARGVDAPTLFLRRAGAGLYPVFERIFTELWERGEPM
jgi:hypothetical protein